MSNYIERDIELLVTGKTAKFNDNVYLFKGDRDIQLNITVKDTNMKFSRVDSNILTPLPKDCYARVGIIKPDGTSIIKDRVPIIDNIVRLVIEGTLIDELEEVGEHKLQIRIYAKDEELSPRWTLPAATGLMVMNPDVDFNAGEMGRIRFDILSIKDLGTLYKDNSVDVDGLEFIAELNLNDVEYILANYVVNSVSYSDTVTIQDIENGIIRVPFKRDVLPAGEHQFEVIARMKNGDVKPSQTFKYKIEKSLENPDSVQADTNYPILIQLIDTVRDVNVNVNKLISDTKIDLQNYKETKNSEINQDLSQYKMQTTEDINSYKSAKDVEIDQYKSNKDAQIDNYVADKNKEIDSYKNTKDTLINEKLSKVETSETNRVEAETLRQQQHESREQFLNGFELKLGQMETDFNEAVANVTNGNESATNSEIVLARKGKTSLREKIDEVDSQIKDIENEKLDKNGIITMSNLGQDVKEAMTDGAVAVVGKNTILAPNIVDNQINQYKVDFINKDNNLLREEYLIFGKAIDINSGALTSNSDYVSTEFIDVDESTKYTFDWYKETPNNPGVYVVYYNSSDVLISNSFVTDFNFTTPANCKKIRISFPNYDILKFQNNFLSKDITKTSPKLKNEYLDESFLNNNFENNFAKKNIEPLNCTFFDKVTNIKDNAQFQKNKTVNPTNGNFESFSGRTILGFYDVKYADAINCNIDCLMFLYDINKSILSSVNGGNIIKSGTVIPITHTTSANDTIFVVIVALTVDDTILNGIVITPSKYKYDGTNKYYLKDSMINSLSNFSFYKNKKITCFGDSITAQNQWQPHVASYFGCTMINKGVGGTTVFNNGHREVIEGVERDSWMCSDDRINLIPSDSDVILVFAGHNDWGYSNLEMGVLGDGNLIDSTFKSAYSLMLKKLVNKFPNAKIIAMTPVGGRTEHENENADNQYYIRDLCMTDFANAIKEVCQYYGIPCIDINGESGISTLNHNTYIADVIHPNSEGGKLIANAAINGMKRFEPIEF